LHVRSGTVSQLHTALLPNSSQINSVLNSVQATTLQQLHKALD
jgi:hypothetical protein